MAHAVSPAFTRRYLGIVLAGLLGLLGLMAYSAHKSYEMAMERAERRAEIQVSLLERFGHDTADKIDVALISVVNQFEDWRTAPLDAGHINRVLARTLATIPSSQSLRIVNARGDFVFDATGVPPPANVVDRRYFQRNRDQHNAGLVISEPIAARNTPNWVVTLSRRLEHPDGQFFGLIQAAIPAVFFENFFRGLDAGDDGVIALYDTEARLFVRTRDGKVPVGEIESATGLAAALAKRQTRGQFVTRHATDDLPRQYTWRHIAPYNLVVAVGFSRDEVLADWRTQARMTAVAGAALTLVIAVQLMLWARSHNTIARDAAHRAERDALTDLNNRAGIHARLAEGIVDAAHTRSLLALIVLDLDNFRQINDVLGHDEGDRLIAVVGRRLGDEFGSRADCARLGGDEFAMVIEVDDDAALAHFMNQAIEVVSRPVLCGKHDLRLFASAGVAVYPDDGQSVEVLFQHAEIAMYEAKARDRSRWYRFDQSMSERVSENLALDFELRLALQRNEFLLYYQPQFQARDGALVGFEALVRWQHPQRGLLPPGAFIARAEATGLIAELGQWVLREACRQTRAWQTAGLPVVRVAVNLSARQFRDVQLVDTVRAALAESALAPELLELELTESLTMLFAERVIEQLDSLHALGIRLAIDDFGTGYSSLAYLKRFPIDTLKIDRSFVCDLPDDEDDTAIVDAVISMGHRLGLRIIAEGVETDAQRDLLTRMACDDIQGYLTGRPEPADVARARLERLTPPA